MTHVLKPYPARKDSGLEWLGEVPEHWEIRRLKNVAEMRISNIDKHTKEGEYPVRLCNYVDVYKNDHISPSMLFMRATATANEIARFRLTPGDVLITKDSEAWDDIGVPALVVESADDLVSGYHLALLRPLGTCLNGGYLLRALQSRSIGCQFHVQANGVTRYGLSHAAIQSVWLPLPPLPEQTSISHFLDYVDRRIRRYIRAKEKLIGLLDEQKQAIIHQAVMGRIDVRTGQPYPAYKDSGLEWLGQMPGHWKRCRLRSVVSIVTTGSRDWSRYASDAGPLFVRVANLSRDSLQLRFEDVVRLDLSTGLLIDRMRIRPEDLLVSVTAYIGSVGIAPRTFEEAYVSQHVARCQPLPNVCPRWLGYVLLSTVGQTHGQMTLYGGTKDGLSLDDVKNYPIILPPLHEQEQAVEWIDARLSSALRTANKAERQIDLLKQYRTRLIADVVTGKLDVSDAATALPKVDPLAGGDMDGPSDTDVDLALENLESRTEVII